MLTNTEFGSYTGLIIPCEIAVMKKYTIILIAFFAISVSNAFAQPPWAKIKTYKGDSGPKGSTITTNSSEVKATK